MGQDKITFCKNGQDTFDFTAFLPDARTSFALDNLTYALALEKENKVNRASS